MSEAVMQLHFGQKFVAYDKPMQILGSTLKQKKGSGEFITYIMFEDVVSKEEYCYSKREFALFIRSKEVIFND